MALTPSLTLLCVSAGAPYSGRFLNQLQQDAETIGAECLILHDGVEVQSHGYLESVLAVAVAKCHTDYLLRLDDDETLAQQTVQWLAHSGYAFGEHWCFARAHLWQDEQHALVNPPLWPDRQTRLSHVALASRDSMVHAASPFGQGTLAPGYIAHHKFLVRSYAERKALMEHYERIQPGSGSGKFFAFQLPEEAFTPEVRDIQPLEVVAELAA